MSWRVFVGIWDDIAYSDRIFDTWEEARANAVAILDQFKNDSCETCRTEALKQQHELLRQTEPGDWIGSVDGGDYVIRKVTGQ